MPNTLNSILDRLALRAKRGELSLPQTAVVIRATQRRRGTRPTTRHNRPFFLYR
ncbi:hypothetical protein QP363_10845 [Corynebacterium sp. UMB6689]|uniref:hypothetical protein n=1 Tax=Corynebacterium sp. UMB6689 TaxID=3046341 RepID=UPI00255163A7|nr:hypothetical protein [Corynebacterium sp. UMB6689]MDK6814485.1 hypothetical protein [Corynebacterium sp. UMB6689]